ncbi:MAG: cyclomaltodextrinase / maltogenic alpha-amylase / neopullulanase [Clostridiales bacterium]|jgi:pullulanase|nr:cyclomaltodextrinase / maltogenic alpha-amylase / neopullulanase [Clostridiales bacterium]MDK2990799.1 cyclomaltodextrinase / maltogenic alpha-amylase / neopullulanase [Clostridiales bacterium]
MIEVYAKHDSHDTFYRTPFGAVKSGSTVTLRIKAGGIENAELALKFFDGSEQILSMTKAAGAEGHAFEGRVDIGDEYTGLINYYFILYAGQNVLYYGCQQDGMGGTGKLYDAVPPPYQITVYKGFTVPQWFKEGIVYQIFVDRFLNGNEDGKVSNPKQNSFIYGCWDDDPMYIRNKEDDIERWEFFGGNLKGVMAKLDYLKSLNVTAIYLNPIFEASSNHKYDTGDYKKIDPMYGDESLFKKLCIEAGKRGIKIILDGVFSHTGADSIYFNKFGRYDSIGAYQSKESPYYSWYRFTQYPYEYECWWNIKNLPNVNELAPSYQNFIIYDGDSVLKHWMNAGAYGWRLDVADELPDEFIEAFKAEMKQVNKDSVLIGEVWEDASNKVSYSRRRRYLFGNELDSVTNYPFRNAVIGFLRGDIDSAGFTRRMMSLYENYPRETFCAALNVLGTHDTERIFTVFEDKGENAYKYAKLAVVIQMTFPGVPLIYYGDEVGIKGGTDPDNRRTYPWGRENDDILAFYKRMSDLRNTDIFDKGDFKFHPSGRDVLCYERSYEGSKAFVFINRNVERAVSVDVPTQGVSIDINALDFKIFM